MDRRSKLAFSVLSTTDIFTIPATERHNRVKEFFTTLPSLQLDMHKEKLQKARQMWATFHHKLYDCDPQASFMNSVLECNEAFIDYNLLVHEGMGVDNFNEDAFIEILTCRNLVIRALKENSHLVPTKVTYKYLNVRVLPAIFSEESTDEERRELCNLVLAFPMGFATQFMSKNSIQTYKRNVINTYIPFVYDSKVFRVDFALTTKTLIHYSGKLLHTDTQLQNALLKVLEEAFKSGIVENRCDGFDCWRSLIDNYALDNKYLMNSKQTALLQKPMRARISRNRLVVAKKFDTHVYLLQKTRFSTELLERFLVDAFGPFDVDVVLPENSTTLNVEHTRDLQPFYPKTTEILLKMLKHDKIQCGCASQTLPITDSCGEIEGEVIDFTTLVHSVRICSQLNIISLQNARPALSIKITKCLWTSLFKYLRQVTFDSLRESTAKSLQETIANVMKLCGKKPCFDTLFQKVFSYFVNFYLTDLKFNVIQYELLVWPVLKEMIIFQEKFPEIFPPKLYLEDIDGIYTYCKTDTMFAKTIQGLLDSVPCQNQLAADTIVFAILDVTRNMSTVPNFRHDQTLKALFIHLLNINCNEDLISPDFGSERFIIPRRSIVFIEAFNKYLKEQLDPTRSVGALKVACSLLQHLVDKNRITDHLFYNYILDTLISVLECLAQDSYDHNALILNCTKLIKNFLESVIRGRELYPMSEINESKLLRIYNVLLEKKMFQMMDSLLNLMQYVQKADIPRSLYTCITGLTDHDNDEISQKAFTIMAQFHGPIARGKDANKRDVAPVSSNPNTVCLFGKYLDSPSPKRSRGSVLERTKQILSRSPTSASKSTIETSVRDLNEMSTCDFVVIDKVVVVDKEKMTEQQLEKLKTRRDDIPALYADLTQSQSLPLSKESEKADEHVSKCPITSSKLTKKSESGNDDKETLMETENTENAKQRRKSVRRTLNATTESSPNHELKSELNRLKMNIVGCDNFCNLPRVRSQRKQRSLGVNPVDFASDDDTENITITTSVKKARKSRKGEKTIVQFENMDMEMKEENELNCGKVPDKECNDEKNTVSAIIENDDTQSSNLESTEVLANEASKDDNHNEDHSKKDEDVLKDVESEGIISPSQDNVRVNLFRLPHYSPTKQELEEAKNRKTKLDLKLDSFAVAKIDFSCLKTTENEELLEKKPQKAKKSKTTSIAGVNNDNADKNDETLTLDMLAETPIENLAEIDTESFLCANASMHLDAKTADDDPEATVTTSTNDVDLVMTPAKTPMSVSSLEASPVNMDTPSRTKDLLDGTLDISPIRSAPVGDKQNGRGSPDLFASQGSQVTQVDANDADESQSTNDVQDYFRPKESTSATKNQNSIDIRDYFRAEDSTSALKTPSSRSAKLLNLIGQTNMKMSSGRNNSGLDVAKNTMSPGTDRIRKMMKFCTGAKVCEEQEQQVQAGDILEFERAVPSPLALPKTSILKRKFPDTNDEGLSPCAKRKRVNFSDPPTTCEKLYFKVTEEIDKPIALRKKKRFVTRLLRPEFDEDSNEEQTDEQEETSKENASDAIQSMQTQIDELGEIEGVQPLDSSSPKLDNNGNGRLSPLPSNPAPELLEEVMANGFEDLFPGESKKLPRSPPPTSPLGRSSSVDVTFMKGVIQLAQNMLSTEEYLKLCVDEIPTDVIKKWLKNREKLRRRLRKHEQ